MTQIAWPALPNGSVWVALFVEYWYLGTCIYFPNTVFSQCLQYYEMQAVLENRHGLGHLGGRRGTGWLPAVKAKVTPKPLASVSEDVLTHSAGWQWVLPLLKLKSWSLYFYLETNLKLQSCKKSTIIYIDVCKCVFRVVIYDHYCWASCRHYRHHDPYPKYIAIYL